MESDKYEQLRARREVLSGLLKKAKAPQHIQQLNTELTIVRKAISDAHRELYNNNGKVTS